MMLLIFSLITWTAAGTEITEFPTGTRSSATTLPPLLRGRHHYPPHRGLQLRKKPKTDSSGSQESTYQGCLGYSESELSQSWIFSGDAPSCSWAHSTGGSNSNSGGSGSGSGSNSTRDCDNESSYDGESDKYGGGWDDDSSDGSNNANDNNVNDDDGGNGDDDGSDGNDYASGNQASTDDQSVVTNEEAYTEDGQYDPIDDFDIEVVSLRRLYLVTEGTKYGECVILIDCAIISMPLPYSAILTRICGSGIWHSPAIILHKRMICFWRMLAAAALLPKNSWKTSS